MRGKKGNALIPPKFRCGTSSYTKVSDGLPCWMVELKPSIISSSSGYRSIWMIESILSCLPCHAFVLLTFRCMGKKKKLIFFIPDANLTSIMTFLYFISTVWKIFGDFICPWHDLSISFCCTCILSIPF